MITTYLLGAIVFLLLWLCVDISTVKSQLRGINNTLNEILGELQTDE